MRNAVKKFGILWLFLCVFALFFVSCKEEDNNSGNVSGNTTNYETIYASLPGNVGTNEFKGKTWSYTNENGSVTYAFADSTLQVTLISSSTTQIDNYRYAYNSTKKNLYTALISSTRGTITFSSVNDYVNYNKNLAAAKGVTWTSGIEAYCVGEAKIRFQTLEILSYSISGSTLTFTGGYFTGSLPTSAEFQKSPLISSTNSGSLKITKFGRIKIEDTQGTYFYIWSSYDNGSFSGTVFNSDKTIEIGTVSGTYTTSGTGTSGCSVTLKFTSIPSAIAGLTTNTSYTLSQLSTTTFTLSLVQ